MTSGDFGPMTELEAILSSAVDRQVSEQRALQDALAGIHGALDELRRDLAEVRERPAPALDPGVLESLVEALSGVRGQLAEVRDRVDTRSGADELAARLDGVAEAVADLPTALFRGVQDAVSPQLDQTALRDEVAGLRAEVAGLSQTAVAELRGALAEVRGELGTVSQDVQALAQALLDLNGNLRDFSDGLSERVASLAETLLDGLERLAETQRDALESLGDAVRTSTKDLRQDVGGLVRETSRSLGSRLDGVSEQLLEARDLTRYLQDQAEDLDKVISGLGDVPQRLEGAVAQALRRALTVRASLVREAEKALERTLSPVEERLEQLLESLDVVTDAVGEGKLTDDVRRFGLQQVELASRLDDLQASLFERIEALRDERRERESVLAHSLDRLGRGQDPEAAAALKETLAPARSRKAPGSPRKPKSAPKAAKKTSAKSSKKKVARTVKASSGKSSRRSRSSKDADEGGGGKRRAVKKSAAKRGGTGPSSRTSDYIPL